MNCDFCNTPDPVWEYPARDVVIDTPLLKSIGEWYACDICSRLIELDMRSVLEIRASASYIQNHYDADPDAVVLAVATIHAAFWNSRTGPRIPLQSLPM